MNSAGRVLSERTKLNKPPKDPTRQTISSQMNCKTCQQVERTRPETEGQQRGEKLFLTLSDLPGVRTKKILTEYLQYLPGRLLHLQVSGTFLCLFGVSGMRESPLRDSWGICCPKDSGRVQLIHSQVLTWQQYL